MLISETTIIKRACQKFQVKVNLKQYGVNKGFERFLMLKRIRFSTTFYIFAG